MDRRGGRVLRHLCVSVALARRSDIGDVSNVEGHKRLIVFVVMALRVSD